ncbi:NRAMP family divalent metal transporter [Catenulispora pinisilvae]|uniref:NRAMP family divalent metal transporter n=1 Tax=Catenulispora pinisilvae TaxID=2705253 RepID=UPI00189255FB|nr:NRAMP family divalent metal transporter [Catenulispora pinisilvae]
MTTALLDHPTTAVLDDAHVGDIKGAFGTIQLGDHDARRGLSAKLKTLLAIVGPGLIVMIGDNDAGAFATYGQAGHDYGTKLLWTLLLLVPVLYVNQEMVLRLGAVTGVGHARLIFERFGKFWGAFSVIDLFLLNALTLVTEFIGITLATGYLGLPKVPSVVLAALVIVAAASTGSFRRFERLALVFCVGSLLLIPISLMAHPAVGGMAHDFVRPSFPGGAGGMAPLMLLIIGIVGTTVAPWQLFFQQSYVIDKRITPRFMKYEKADLWIGIVVVVIGGAAIMGLGAVAFAAKGAPDFTNAGSLATALQNYGGRALGDMFAVALLDASIIGAFAVSLSTAYAIGDVFKINHSLHRGVKQAKGFYAVYAGVIALAATIVLTASDHVLGVLTTGVQALAGVLLPSATVFLLLLCVDKEVLGPWVNSKKTTLFTSAVIGVLIALSMVLTASVIWPAISTGQIDQILVGCAVGALAAAGFLGVKALRARRTPDFVAEFIDRSGRDEWRMPPLAQLGQLKFSRTRRYSMGALRLYLLVSMVMCVWKLVEMMLGH